MTSRSLREGKDVSKMNYYPDGTGTYLNPNNAATGYFSQTMDEKGT